MLARACTRLVLALALLAAPAAAPATTRPTVEPMDPDTAHAPCCTAPLATLLRIPPPPLFRSCFTEGKRRKRQPASFASSRTCDCSRALSGCTASVGPVRKLAKASRTAAIGSTPFGAVSTLAGARQIWVTCGSAAPSSCATAIAGTNSNGRAPASRRRVVEGVMTQLRSW